jgi:transcriptional regulator with XRE-family HTH domain
LIKTYGSVLRSLRKKRQLRISDVADLVGLHTSYLSRIETGEKRVPPERVKRALCDALKLTKAEINDLQSAIDNMSTAYESWEDDDRLAVVVMPRKDFIEMVRSTNLPIFKRIRRKGGSPM